MKDLTNFWKILDVLLINCAISLTLTWSRNCVLTDERMQDASPNANPSVLENRVSEVVIFEIKDRKLYVPVVTLSTEDDDKLLEQLKIGFKRTIKWNKYRSEVTTQAKIITLNYLIDPTFSKVNRLFLLSFVSKVLYTNS